MSTFIASLEERFAENGALAHRLVDGLSPEQLAWRPGRRLWSAGEVLAHLIRTADAYEEEARAAIERARAEGKTASDDAAVRHSFLGRRIIKRVQPDFEGSTPAPPAFRPAADVPPDVAARFYASREQIASLLRESKGLDLEAVRVKSPVIPLIRLNLADALRLLVDHEGRHLKQVERTLAAEGFPQT
jgi:uncharacterized damage-inducible protein DinB